MASQLPWSPRPDTSAGPVTMADQAVWYKLWCSALMDPALSNLDIADFGRWAKLGMLIKQQGTDGTVLLQSPGRQLCSTFQVDNFSLLQVMLHRLPGLNIATTDDTVTGVTSLTVTLRKWSKYQGDNSQPRVARFRERVTAKKRREEKRREVPPKPPGDFAMIDSKEAKQFVSELTKNLAAKWRP